MQSSSSSSLANNSSDLTAASANVQNHSITNHALNHQTNGFLKTHKFQDATNQHQSTCTNNNGENNATNNGNSSNGTVPFSNGTSSSINSNGANSELLDSNGTNNNKQTSFTEKSFTSGQRDILRLIGQQLRYLGLNRTTDMLIKESGCMLEHPIAANFCSLIMNGQWDEAENALIQLKMIMSGESAENDLTNMRFLILEQKYLECLEDGKIIEALRCLRDELAPLRFNTERLHELSSFLMCTDQLNLKSLSKWAGKNEHSRRNLMDKLQVFLPPHIMLPPRRLEALLNQAIEYQCERCPYHNFKQKSSLDEWSFLRDHVCSKEDFPSVTLQIINDHCDEVWFCKFSNNGKRLASGSKDGSLIIWDVDEETYKLTMYKSFEEHTCGVALITWSPDDRYLIVCGTEECTEIWIWDVENKCLKKRFNNSHDDSLTSAAWLPDGQTFVTGGMKGHFYNCDLDGNIRETWEGVRVRCLQTLPDGIVLAADSLKRVRSYNFKEITDSNLIQEDFQIMSFTMNKSGTQMLISVASQGVHLWDVKDKVLVRRFQGNIQNNFMNYSSFGGADEIYLASGSEDSRVYIWHVKKENPICVLEGHTRSVTCVSWNPQIPGMIVSASDDGTLRVWGPKSKATHLDGILSNGSSDLATNNHDSSKYHANNTNNRNNNNNNNENNQSNMSNRSERSTPV